METIPRTRAEKLRATKLAKEKRDEARRAAGLLQPKEISATGFIQPKSVAEALESDDSGARGVTDADIEIPEGLRTIAPVETKALSAEWSRRQLIDTRIEKPAKDEDTEKFVTRRLAALSIEAVRELEFSIKFGDDKKRMEAAAEILDRHGFAKNDARVAMARSRPPIVINVGSEDVKKVPWLARTLAKSFESGTDGGSKEEEPK